MNKKEVLACLEHVPIFDALSDAEKNKLATIAVHDKYSKNDYIYTHGDDLDALYVVHEGSVQIVRYSHDGREQVIRVLNHGDFFGETALFGNKKVSDYAEISEDAVVCKIEQKSFKKMIEEMPTIASKMLLELSNRLSYIEEAMTFNNLKTAEAKLAKYLLDNRVDNVVILNSTKKTISAQLGITPETFSRRLKSFEKKRIIKSITNKKIKIIDQESLEELIYL